MTRKQQLADAAYHYAVRFNVQANAHRSDRLGTFGPASPVRRINPQTGEVMTDQDGHKSATEFLIKNQDIKLGGSRARRYRQKF